MSPVAQVRSLLDVWREVGRYLDLHESVGLIGPWVARVVPLRALALRHVDAAGGRVDTLASHPSDGMDRWTALAPGQTEAVLAWLSSGSLRVLPPDEGSALRAGGNAAEADRRALLSRLDRQDVSEAIVGAEGGPWSVLERVDLGARTDAPVLILGETGSSKEVVARAIHHRSRRAVPARELRRHPAGACGQRAVRS